MNGLLFRWEEGWFAPYAEMQVWVALARAYNLSHVIMIPHLKYGNQDIELAGYDSMEEFLDSDLKNNFTLVFVETQSLFESNNIKAVELSEFVHPDNALYIFGTSFGDNTRYITDKDLTLFVKTPTDVALWQHSVAGIILDDRYRKSLA